MNRILRRHCAQALQEAQVRPESVHPGLSPAYRLDVQLASKRMRSGGTAGATIITANCPDMIDTALAFATPPVRCNTR